MTDIQRADRRGRRLIAWGGLAAVTFGMLAFVWTLILGFGGYHLAPPDGSNPWWVLSAAFLGATLLAMLVLGAGIAQLLRLPPQWKL